MSAETDFDDNDIQEDPDWKVASDWCAELIADLAHVPDRAQDFRDSVAVSVENMKRWIDEHHTVSDRQLIALENWQEATERILSHS